jgi:hypothetical protein
MATFQNILHAMLSNLVTNDRKISLTIQGSGFHRWQLKTINGS